MITYAKAHRLDLRRSSAPQFPFWQRTTVAPYGSSATRPISIDFQRLTGTPPPRGEVRVTHDPADLLGRERRLEGPALVQSSGFAESVFHRGAEAATFLVSRSIPVVQLITAEGEPPEPLGSGHVLAIATWPPDLRAIDWIAGTASDRGVHWGLAIPLVFPVTTRLAFLSEVASIAENRGAEFLTAVPVELEPTAKRLVAESAEEMTDDDYDLLFHGDLETILVASERHVSALAAERGFADFVPLPGLETPTNWNAAMVLALAGTRMIRMKSDVEMGWELIRSASVVASLDKAVTTIAASASLSIVEQLGDAAAGILEEWLGNRSAEFLRQIDLKWRLRRDEAH